MDKTEALVNKLQEVKEELLKNTATAAPALTGPLEMSEKEYLNLYKNGQWSLEKGSFKDIKPKVKPLSAVKEPLTPKETDPNHIYNKVPDSGIKPFSSEHIDITAPTKNKK